MRFQVARALGLVGGFLPLASPFDIARVIASTPPVPEAQSPCPRDQLLFYLAHVGGNGDAEAAVLARPVSSSPSDVDGDEWYKVGTVAACTNVDNDIDPGSDPFAFGLESAVARAQSAAHALAQATMMQRRLIEQHACRLHPMLRDNGNERVGLELGLQMLEDTVVPIPPSADATLDDSTEMMRVGFAGLVSAEDNSSDEVAKSGDTITDIYSLYKEFWESGGAEEYDPEPIQRKINDVIAKSCNEVKPSVLVFSSSECKATEKLRKYLDGQSILHTEFIIQTITPMHAELALMTGKPSTPYVFVSGELINVGEGVNESMKETLLHKLKTSTEYNEPGGFQ